MSKDLSFTIKAWGPGGRGTKTIRGPISGYHTSQDCIVGQSFKFFSVDQDMIIREMRSAGAPIKDIAERFNVPVNAVLTRWRELEKENG